MQVTRTLFEVVTMDTRQGFTTKEIAERRKTSKTIVNRIRRAGSWERLPYISARDHYGYMTPEYKAHLKRKGLALRTPPKPQAVRVGYLADKNKHGIEVTKPEQKQSLLQRVRAWIQRHF